ncbi:MAG: DUF362 domain-containing protein [Deltaproteobacteria bacterium]|jgi:uncharacterized protein (DUF362 family)|nr:DUF362 domain-containing protein [Deltaproteobacteria bacterium]
MFLACHTVPYRSYEDTIPNLLDAIGAADVLANQKRVLIKPNLVNSSPPPITLPVEACRALVRFCRSSSQADIVIAEGTGDPSRSTHELFVEHGYDSIAKEFNLDLVDLNEADLIELSNPECRFFPRFMMPKVVMDSYVVSAAPLKAHSLAKVTLSMKNMIGVAPPAYYQRGGFWRKSLFHEQMQTSIFELNCYRKPDLAFLDASVGMAEHHLGGPTCDPPVRKLVAGFDPVAVDATGAELLGISWHHVGHIKMANGVLGKADPT